MTMRNGLVGLKAQLKTRLEWPSNSPTLVPESHLSKITFISYSAIGLRTASQKSYYMESRKRKRKKLSHMPLLIYHKSMVKNHAIEHSSSANIKIPTLGSLTLNHVPIKVTPFSHMLPLLPSK